MASAVCLECSDIACVGRLQAHADFALDNGKVMKCSRDIACIFYLTKEWQRSDGGVLIDKEGPSGDRVRYTLVGARCVCVCVCVCVRVCVYMSVTH